MLKRCCNDGVRQHGAAFALLAILTCSTLTALAREPDKAFTGMLQMMAAEAHIPALAVALKLPGQPVQTIAIGRNVRTTTPFRFGSITKSFTAIALLKAAELRGVAITTPLDKVIPAGRFTNRFTQPVSLYDLAALTAGHTDVSGAAFNDNTARPLAAALELNRDTLTSLWPPGLLHSYTNATPGLSALAIEHLTGLPYEAAMKKLLFTPMALDSASFHASAELPGGFKADGVTPIPYWNVTFLAFGGLNMSIDDMGQFVDTMLREGRQKDSRIWSDDINKRLTSPAPSLATLAGLAVGYGAGVYSRLRRGRLWHGHGGDADGYRSRYAFLPQEDAGYAVVINTDNPAALIRLEELIEARIIAQLPARSVELPITQPARTGLDGEFYPATVRFGQEQWARCELPRLLLRTGGDTLFMKFPDRRKQLRSVNGHLFATPGEVRPVAALHRDSEGVVWFLGEFGNYVRVRARDNPAPVPIPAFLPACVTE